MKKTIKPYTYNYEGFGPVTVPEGTRITNRTALGIDPNYNFVAEFEWIDRDYPTVSKCLRHDATFYGINVPKEYVN